MLNIVSFRAKISKGFRDMKEKSHNNHDGFAHVQCRSTFMHPLVYMILDVNQIYTFPGFFAFFFDVQCEVQKWVQIEIGCFYHSRYEHLVFKVLTMFL